ncbi:MAG: HlyD family efflux transporter periplasmic adaptor subunit [Lachnospiraceae bacterium]|nr:HlyD family efflux transporter periplasmic adaptor subunit [Lachnospiraceae bacterium]
MNTFYESIKDDVAKLQAAFAERSSLELNSANPNADFATWLSTNPTPGGVTSSSTADDIQNIIEGINYNGRPADNSDPTNPQPATGYYAKTEAYNSAQTAYEAAYKSYSEAAAAYNSFGSASSSQGAYNSAKSEYDNAKNNYDNLVQMKANAALSGTELKNKIAQLENDKTAAQDDLDQLLKDIPGEIELNSTARALKEKQEELQKLLDNAVGATVKAPVAGKIVDISVVSGGKAEANATIATIQPEDKGFTLKISVSAEQAKKVSIGSPAEIQNAWYYNDITVELKAIQNDPANPGKNKLLVFDVSGDVSDGQSLSVSVGSKSQNYDLIVPNSAIRSDDNGKFILIVDQKSSPIGNRYYATRVDIEEVAKDDTQTAISAPLNGWEFVITAATKPVDPGMQVRLAE